MTGPQTPNDGYPASNPAYGPPQHGQPPYGPPQQRPAQQGPMQQGPMQQGRPPGGPQPPKSKAGWIIGGVLVAVIAIVAVVLIVILGSDDDSGATAGPGGAPGQSAPANPGEQGGPGEQAEGPGAGSGSAPTCAPGEYGVKIDPQTGDSIVCDGGGAQQQTQTDAEAMNGSWSVTATITAIDGVLYNEGVALQVGDSTWAGPHDWSIQAAFCPTGSNCTLTVSDQQASAFYTFAMQGTSWTGETTYPIYCDDGSEDHLQVSFELPVQPLDATSTQGTMTTVSEGACGGEVLTIVEELTLNK